jgi:hypothetical protein
MKGSESFSGVIDWRNSVVLFEDVFGQLLHPHHFIWPARTVELLLGLGQLGRRYVKMVKKALFVLYFDDKVRARRINCLSVQVQHVTEVLLTGNSQIAGVALKWKLFVNEVHLRKRGNDLILARIGQNIIVAFVFCNPPLQCLHLCFLGNWIVRRNSIVLLKDVLN